MAILPSPIVKLSDPLFSQKHLQVFIKRDDLIHPEISGNKWRKLKYNLEEAKNGNYKGIVTLGGAFSNHVAATAAACRIHKIQSIGIIRGDELNAESNRTLKKATEDGMKLVFVSREEYALLRNNQEALSYRYPGHFIVPEGGSNEHAIKGVMEVWDELDGEYDYLISPFGTGGTLAGLLAGNKGNTKIIGISSLKGGFVKNEFSHFLKRLGIMDARWELMTGYHFGGYGKVTSELLAFISLFENTHGVPLDPVYTGKMVYGFYDLVTKNFFPEKTRILVLHTGGLQGKDGYKQIQSRKIR